MGASAPLADPPEPHGGECGRVSGRAEPSLRTASRYLSALACKKAMASVRFRFPNYNRDAHGPSQYFMRDSP